MHNDTANGFTLIELLVYIAIVGVLSSFIYASVEDAQLRGRDARRIADASRIVHALELYKDQNSVYPLVTTPGGSLYGWEVSFIPDFLEALEPYIAGGMPKDPLNIGPPTHTDGAGPGCCDEMFNTRPDGSYFYMYYRYPGGGLCGPQPYAVVGFRAIESKAFNKAKFSQARCGPQPCTVAQWGTCRDWSHEFDYSVILFE